MVHRWEAKTVKQGFVRDDRLGMFEAVAVAATGWEGTVSGKTSMSFTAQSASLPLVDAYRFTSGAPLTRTGFISGSLI
jgi:hypothetical protein